MRGVLVAAQRLIHQQRENPRQNAAHSFVPGVFCQQEIAGVHSADHRDENAGKLADIEPLSRKVIHYHRRKAHDKAVQDYHCAVLRHRVAEQLEYRYIEQALEIAVISARRNGGRPVKPVCPRRYAGDCVFVRGEVEHGRHLRHQHVNDQRDDVQRRHKEPVAGEHAGLSGSRGGFRLFSGYLGGSVIFRFLFRNGISQRYVKLRLRAVIFFVDQWNDLRSCYSDRIPGAGSPSSVADASEISAERLYFM